MSTANRAAELDFGLSFEEDRRQTVGLDPNVGTPPSFRQTGTSQPLSPELQSHLPFLPVTDQHRLAGCQSQGTQYDAQGNPRVFQCPSIQITTFSACSHTDLSSQDGLAVAGAEGGYPEVSWCRDHLYLPLDTTYRDLSFIPSPCSSLSSRSCRSDISSCESFSHISDDNEMEPNEVCTHGPPLPSPGCAGGSFGVELWQLKYQMPQAVNPTLSPYQSPCHSPRTSVTEENWLTHQPTSRSSSRPTSPCGKRPHSNAELHTFSPSPQHSPSPTPSASRRGSATDETWVGSPAGMAGFPLMSGYQELDVPSKTRRTSTSQLAYKASQGDSGLEDLIPGIPFLNSPGDERGEQDDLAELFLPVPFHFTWNKPKHGEPPLFRSLSPPPLDWPLPSQFDQWELKLEVQPKSYHRAQYETEGSRGSIKAATGGHPVIKVISQS
ncbi:hypothetical protein LDENG_00225790 [Lucifuga dentata]|nr:hypothetical protein LDENG_00225790 [Lucifuga dentata]